MKLIKSSNFVFIFWVLFLVVGLRILVAADSRGAVQPDSSLDQFEDLDKDVKKPDLDVLALAKQRYLTALEYYEDGNSVKAEEEFNKVLWYLTQARLDVKDHYKLSLIYRSLFKKIKPRVIDQTALRQIIPPIDTDINIIITPEVNEMIKVYRTKRSAEMRGGLSRSKKYLPMIRKIFREEKIPTDLAYMALIESTFRPKIASRAGAQGMWQFMRATGKVYGLRVDKWVDERNDPEKSTRAAAKYVKSLYEMLGSWLLVQAGYNGGEYRVQRAITKARSRDFWELAKKRYLPYETRYYVYSFMAAVIIAKNPEMYGFNDIEYEPEVKTERVNVKDCIDLNVLAKAAGLTFDELKKLNPALKSWCTPPNYPEFELVLPAGTKEEFLAKLEKIPASERLRWRTHRVRKGETLSVIAQRYNATVRSIMKASRLRNAHRLSIGQVLNIPIGPEGYVPTGAYPSGGGGNGKRKVSYRVRKGDTLSRIARIYGVLVNDVRRWNNMSASRYIYPGESLTIYATN